MWTVPAGKPALDEVVDFSRRRVFADRYSAESGLYWFETSPGVFHCEVDWPSAREFANWPGVPPASLNRIIESEGGLTDVTHRFPTD